MTQYHLAVIDEATCIGCTKCLAVCPVDAIVGATQQMHTVLKAECIGCDLCLPPCPVQCITLIPSTMNQKERVEQTKVTKQRVLRRKERIRRTQTQKAAADSAALQNAQAIIAATLARAKAKKSENLVPYE